MYRIVETLSKQAIYKNKADVNLKVLKHVGNILKFRLYLRVLCADTVSIVALVEEFFENDTIRRNVIAR